MISLIQTLLIMLLFSSVLGYILSVLKEKYYLKNNIILIENKHISQELLDKTELKEFYIDGTKLKAGDEISLVTRKKEKLKGTLIGATKRDKSILLITYSNKVLKCNIDNILYFKIVSKYGKFFV